MLLYQKYIIKNVIPIFLVVTFSITSLVWVTQVLKMLYLFDKGIKITIFLNLIILVLPSLLFVLLPVIAAIAVIYTYNNLKIERQLIILQALGVNNLQLAKPALYVSFLVMLLAYYLSAAAMPLSYINLKSRLNFVKNNYISNMVEEKTFNKISKDVSIYIDKKSANNLMTGLIVFDNRDAENIAILFAKSGILNMYGDNPVFQLDQGARQVYDKNGNLTQLTFSSLMIQISNDHKLLEYERGNHNRNVNEYYISELLNPSDELPAQKKTKLIAEAHQRMIWPLYNFVLPFLGLAVFFKYPYNKKTTFIPILFAAIMILIVTSMHFILQNLAAKNLSFIFYCYLNIFVFIIIGLYLFFSRSTNLS
jgi:lipopolysaccharide export system permease protein